MNIQVLQYYIEIFEQEIIDSGFKRDLDDYTSSLPASQNNIVAIREIANKVLSVLDHLYRGDLPDSLANLLPKADTPPFTEKPHYNTLKDLIEDTKIQQDEFFDHLTSFLSELQSQIQLNIDEIAEVQDFISPYVLKDVEQIAAEKHAIIAIVFNDQSTITSLDRFTKTLAAWNRVLLIYHQLLKSESPKNIEIVEVQNGSIDCVVNLNVDVALDLVALFKLGFQVFVAYLSYQKMIKPIIDSYYGNKQLVSQEEERERLLLDNIGIAIQKEVEAQHKKASKKDRRVDGTAVPKKVEQVSRLITAHIVKGNDLRLLALPQREEVGELEDKLPEVIEALREQSVAARRQLRQMPADAQRKLLEAYGTINEESE